MNYFSDHSKRMPIRSGHNQPMWGVILEIRDLFLWMMMMDPSSHYWVFTTRFMSCQTLILIAKKQNPCTCIYLQVIKLFKFFRPCPHIDPSLVTIIFNDFTHTIMIWVIMSKVYDAGICLFVRKRVVDIHIIFWVRGWREDLTREKIYVWGT